MCDSECLFNFTCHCEEVWKVENTIQLTDIIKMQMIILNSGMNIQIWFPKSTMFSYLADIAHELKWLIMKNLVIQLHCLGSMHEMSFRFLLFGVSFHTISPKVIRKQIEMSDCPFNYTWGRVTLHDMHETCHSITLKRTPC